MKEGLLWADLDSARTLAEKVGDAARRYREKFGVAPDTCCVHPSAANGKATVNGVAIVPLPSVLRYHFWLGVETKASSPGGDPVTTQPLVTKATSPASDSVTTQLSFMEEQ